MRKLRTFWVQLCILLASAAGLRAEKYALVAGVGKYPYVLDERGRPAMDLDGARPDGESIVAMLVRYGYQRDHVTFFADVQATRAAILGELDRLAALVKPGDQVVFYYSGHGTSSLDTNTGGFGMDPATGAIVPSDLRPGSRDSVLAQLIVGKRDLQPRLARIEEKARVLVIFDACFSGESVKSIAGVEEASPRYVSLSDLTRGGVSSDAIKAAERSLNTRGGQTDYPYHQVVYLSASANNQFARDITRDALNKLSGRFRTVDGGPHGAFTNALLQLMGDGTTGSTISCREVYERGIALVNQEGNLMNFKQDPQLLYPLSKPELVESPCILPDTPSTPSTGAGIRTELDKLAAGASSKIECRHSEANPARRTVLTCTAPEAGNLYVLSYGMGDAEAVLLFPNTYVTDSHVPKGTVQIPPDRTFNIDNYLPAGLNQQEQVMLILFSQAPLDVKNLGSPQGIFRSIPLSSLTRSQQVSPGYGAAELVFEIRR
jgi:Caspase domain